MAQVNVFLFVPNLIGYGRIVFGVASLFYMNDSPYIAMTLYWLSAFLDAFDGMGKWPRSMVYYSRERRSGRWLNASCAQGRSATIACLQIGEGYAGSRTDP